MSGRWLCQAHVHDSGQTNPGICEPGLGLVHEGWRSCTRTTSTVRRQSSSEEGTASGIKLCGPGNDWVANTGLEKTTSEVSLLWKLMHSLGHQLCGRCEPVFLYAPSSPCVGTHSLCLFAGHSKDCSFSYHQRLPSGILFPVLYYLVLLCPLSSSPWTVIIGSAEALPILCVRYIRWERDTERERERRKWRHHCRAKIGDEFCTSPCQKCAPQYWRRVLRFSLPKILHLSFSPFEMRWVHTFRCQKRCTFRNSSYSSHCQMAWLTGDRSSKANERISGCTVLLSRRKKSKKWIKLIPKTIGNRKRDCAWGCAWGINTTWENLQIEKHKSGRRSFHSPSWFVLFDLQISQVVFIPQAQPHAQSLFLFPIVFGNNLIISDRYSLGL